MNKYEDFDHDITVTQEFFFDDERLVTVINCTAIHPPNNSRVTVTSVCGGFPNYDEIEALTAEAIATADHQLIEDLDNADSVLIFTPTDGG